MNSNDAPNKLTTPIEASKRFRISLTKLGAWLEENRISSKCPFCSTNSWTVPQNETVVGCAIPWGDGWGEMFTGGMPVIAMVCNKCFFVRQLALDRGLRDIVGEVIENAP